MMKFKGLAGRDSARYAQQAKVLKDISSGLQKNQQEKGCYPQMEDSLDSRPSLILALGFALADK